jgi:hypothetical protein
VERQQEEEQLEPVDTDGTAEDVPSQRQGKTKRALIEEMKGRAINGFSATKGVELVRRNSSYFWSADRQLRACCTVSKRYDNDYQPYWYAYHPKWDEFLKEGDGYLIIACMDLDSAFAVPRQWFAENERNLSVAGSGSRSYLHLPLTTLDDGSLAINVTRLGCKYPLEPYRFPLASHV